MINVNKLKGKLVEHQFTIEEVAKMLGIDRATLYRKINKQQGETFTIKEVNQLVTILQLTKEEALAIFFANLVA